MPIAILFRHRDPKPWAQEIQHLDAQIDVQIWPDVEHPEAIDFVLTWYHPPGSLQQFPNLRCVHSLGAGVDHILQDADLPQHVLVARVVDPLLTISMSQFLVMAVLHYTNHIADYSADKQKRRWQPRLPRRPKETTVGIMGLGVMGAHAAEQLHRFGFRVVGWRRNPEKRPPSKVRVFTGPGEFAPFLNAVDVLINLLPLTPETAEILNAGTFRLLGPGAYLINVARGHHVVEKELLQALDDGHLSGAWLDVFREEPLPPEHPFWQHPKLILTPHISSVSNPKSVAKQIVDNYHRLRNGKPLLHLVDRRLGY